MLGVRIVLLILNVFLVTESGLVADESGLQDALLAGYDKNVRPDDTVNVMVALTAEHVIELVTGAGSGLVADESGLQDALLAGYNKNVRPDDTVNVMVALTAEHVIELNIVDQHMVFSGGLYVSWSDRRLSWNPADYGNISEIYVSNTDIWKPLLVLRNSADDITALGDKDTQRSFPIRGNDRGLLMWVAPAFLKSLCPANVALFPFDTQTCELMISTWQISFTKINLTLFNDQVYQYSYSENGEYKLLRTYAEMRDSPSFRNHKWKQLVFGFVLKRRYSYYVINIILPVIFLKVLGVFVFLVPATSGEKLAFALTLLLSLVVMATIVSEKIPTTSLDIPVLSIYMLECVALAVAEVLVTVYILQLHRWHEERRTPGRGHVVMTSLMAKMAKCRRRPSVADHFDNRDQVCVTSGQLPGDKDHTNHTNHTNQHTAETRAETDLKQGTTITYVAIADAVETVCFRLFFMLTIVFSLQVALTVING